MTYLGEAEAKTAEQLAVDVVERAESMAKMARISVVSLRGNLAAAEAELRAREQEVVEAQRLLGFARQAVSA